MPSIEEDLTRLQILRFAEGGKVKKAARAFDRVAQLQQTHAPRIGMFSVADELLTDAPFEKAPREQWINYLKPGRTFQREGVNFFLNQEEADLIRNQLKGQERVDESGPVEAYTKQQVRDIVWNTFPQFQAQRGTSDWGGMVHPFGSLDEQYQLRNEDWDRIKIVPSRWGGEEEGRLAHLNPDPNLDTGYEEDITLLRGLNFNQSHFPRNTISWSRTSRLPAKSGTGNVRLIEEIQSDLHQAARKKGGYKGTPALTRNWNTDEEVDLTQLPVFLGVAEGIQGPQYTAYIRRGNKYERFSLESATQGGAIDELLSKTTWQTPEGKPNPYQEVLDTIPEDPYDIPAVSEEDARESFLRPPKAPFADTPDYARHELRKQLINAAEGGDQYLALTRGMDQAARYNFPEGSDRAKGTSEIYDVIYLKELKKLAKQYGAEMEDVQVDTYDKEMNRPPVFQEYGAEDAEHFMDGLEEELDEVIRLRYIDAPQKYEGEARRVVEAANFYFGRMEPYLTNLGFSKQKEIQDHMTDLLNALQKSQVTFEEAVKIVQEYPNFPQTQEAALKKHRRSWNKARKLLKELESQSNLLNPIGNDHTKDFPALVITPEVRNRILKAGVPLFAEGGKVKTLSTLAEQYGLSKAPQPGMFSTADRLIESAPFEKAPVDQWMNYLKPGRSYKQEGVEFPLKKAELEESTLTDLLTRLKEFPDVPLTKANLLEALREHRPEFNLGLRTEGWENALDVTPDHRMFETTEPKYDDPRLSHQSLGSEYQESVTGVKGVNFPSHFGPDTLSWSRATRHISPPFPAGPNTPRTRTRVIEEIQSDLHQKGRAKGYMGDPYTKTVDSDKGPLDLNTVSQVLIPGPGYQNVAGIVTKNKDGSWKWHDIEGMTENGRAQIEKIAQAKLEDIPTVKSRSTFSQLTLSRPPRAPFAGTENYGAMELRKQLYSAAEEGDDYLALTRGDDQVERYSQGLSDQDKEGTKYIYDVIYRKEMEKLARQFGAEMEDVPVQVSRTTDRRPNILTEYDAESAGDFIGAIWDNVEESEDAVSMMTQLLSEFEEGMPEGYSIPSNLLDQAQRKVVKAYDAARALSERDEGVDLDPLLQRMDTHAADLGLLLEDIEGYYSAAWSEFDGPPQPKTFPAIKLTPEIRAKILKTGVPLYSAAGAAVMLEELPSEPTSEPERYAEGGKVKTLSTLAEQYGLAKAPQPGMFSTIDRLVESAPFEKVPADQWLSYLKPGRSYKQEGLEFPLKKSELEDLPIEDFLSSLGKDSVTRAELLQVIRENRPEFQLWMGIEGFDQMAPSLRQKIDEARAVHLSPLVNKSRLAWSSPKWADYDSGRLTHRTPGSAYEENVTNLKDLKTRTHFKENSLSWSRTSQHTLPVNDDIESPKRIRVVEEIQSDHHQRGRNMGYKTPEELARLRYIQHSGEQMTDRDMWASEKPTYAPFADTPEYAGLELRKQLLTAAEKDEDYLALVQGIDQIKRYSLTGKDAQGTAYIYDTIYRKELNKLARQYGAEVEEISVPIDSDIADLRVPILQEFNAENMNDLAVVVSNNMAQFFDDDYLEAVDIVKDAVGQMTQDMLDPSAIPEHHLRNIVMFYDRSRELFKEIDRIKNEGPSRDVMKEGELMRDYRDLLRLMGREGAEIERVYIKEKRVTSPEKFNKTFPAIKLTPEIREKIKRVGVPLYGAAGATVLMNEEEPTDTGIEELRQFAEGGKVKGEDSGDFKMGYEEGGPVTGLDRLKRVTQAIPEGLDTLGYYKGAGALENLIRRQLGYDQISPEATKAEDQEALLRLLGGTASQWYGRDPETGDLVPSFTPEHIGSVRPGVVDELLGIPALGEIFGADVPEWASAASERQAKMAEDLEAQLGLEPAQGFGEHFAGSLGVMAGQVPIPGNWIKQIKNVLPDNASATQRLAELAKRTGLAPVEWLSPIVDPKLSNYLIGATFGGGLGTLLDEPAQEAGYGSWEDLRAAAEAGDEEALELIQVIAAKYAEAEAATGGGGGYAEGGKVHMTQPETKDNAE